MRSSPGNGWMCATTAGFSSPSIVSSMRLLLGLEERVVLEWVTVSVTVDRERLPIVELRRFSST